jgi:hypothetical protein
LAKKIGPRISKPATVEKVLNHVRDSDCRCLGRIKRLSRDYRIGKNEDISNEYPVTAVAQKVVEAIEEGMTVSHENVAAELFEFYPQNRQLNDFITEHIKSRIQNSNCHHLKKRGQSSIKQGLTKVANAIGIPLDQIIHAESLNAIKKYIHEYEAVLKAG